MNFYRKEKGVESGSVYIKNFGEIEDHQVDNDILEGNGHKLGEVEQKN